MLKLYGGSRSRASIVHWYLEELGVPYEFVMLDMAAGEHRQPEFRTINPFGKVPAIVDGDFKLWESGAILLYIAEKYDVGLASLEARSIANQWLMFANSTLTNGVFVEAMRERDMDQLMTTLNAHFSQHPYVLGDQFSVADVGVGSILCYIPMMLKLDLSGYPAVLGYMQRISDRPAFQKTIANRE